MPVFKRYNKTAKISVTEVMTKPPISIKAGSSLQAAAELMWDRKVGSIIVLDDFEGRVVGMFTERDIVYCAAKHLFNTQRETLLDSVMSRNVVSVSPEESTTAVIEKMRAHNLRHMPVVDLNGVPIGMVSLRDILDVSLTLLGLFTPPDVA